MNINVNANVWLRERPGISFNWAVGQAVPKQRYPRRSHVLELTCTNEQKIHVNSKPKTKGERPASLDGPLTVTVQSGTATAVVDPDGKGLTLISSDDPGDTTFLVDGDADLGAGVEDVQDTIVLHVIGANAANLGLSADAPVDK